ncbi:MAG: acetyl/propionyl-CoA carboxylase alpha subunit/acetyl-CoA carboxylase carboxyltransferase component [Acidimicrobiales bacterium]|jgi:acetyl/propionyl-CoA carboxylase alpha subunit/acetyl-CoA carboxylase carboxyltransferase component
MQRLLIANRGEIAIRIAQTAADMGIETVAVFSEDDAQSLHTQVCDQAAALDGTGPAAYLDMAGIVAAAKAAGADAVHPGYGFLAENGDFARACIEAGLTFVGPSPEGLDLFGDKVEARRLAAEVGIPLLPGTDGSTALDAAQAFFSGLESGTSAMLKAVAGGGGRGMRLVHNEEDLAEAFERSQSEALAAFGRSDVFIEQYLPYARHIEVQVVGDGTGAVMALGERDCSVQRQNQKILEVAPAPNLHPEVQARLHTAACDLAKAAKYKSVGTFEFLVSADDDGPEATIAFLECNARLQVEHTVTEAVTGLDLVKIQLELAAGETLLAVLLGDTNTPEPQGFAIQARINMETMQPDATVKPSGGTLTAFDPPSGRGVRVDHYGYTGYRTNPRFDSLLAKVIVHADGGYEEALRRTERALRRFRIGGVATNLGFLQSVLAHETVQAGTSYTRFIEENIGDLLAADASAPLHFAPAPDSERPKLAGARVDPKDPLAVLVLGREENQNASTEADNTADADGPEGTEAIRAPMQGTIVSLAKAEGDTVVAGEQLLIMEAMKMEHMIAAPVSGIVRLVAVEPGETVFEDHALVFVEPADVDSGEAAEEEEIDLDHIRPDLAEVEARRARTLDENRPDAVARRRKTNHRTARENITDLVDEGSFHEYGAFQVASRQARHSMDELIDRTPADGLIAGLARVNGDQFDDEHARAMVMSYDYTVLAGTQGFNNHLKKDRMFALTADMKLPLIIFAEGGGGRPGDTDKIFSADIHIPAFNLFAKLSGLAPMVGITTGRCFAGNAVLLGCCDVVIATKDSNIGMGGPAMIEGGGLGVYTPEEVGPMSVQKASGVVDIAVEDEAEAVAVAKKYLSYFQGPTSDYESADQRWLRRAIPENRLRVYEVREVIETIADTDSVLEIRRDFGEGMITSFARIEGRPIGIIANNPKHLGGAIDSPAADKAARFMQLCDAFDIPIVSLIDTPGNMVGPEYEKTALVRHCCRVFVIGANLTVPFFSVTLRKGYGLGAQGMAAGGYHAPSFSIAWPTAEFGGMGLEGAVKLGYRNELAAIEDPEERLRVYEEKVAGMYEQGKALTAATYFEIDNVIDPADTRDWIVAGLRSAAPPKPRDGKKHSWIDTW